MPRAARGRGDRDMSNRQWVGEVGDDEELSHDIWLELEPRVQWVAVSKLDETVTALADSLPALLELMLDEGWIEERTLSCVPNIGGAR